MAHAISLYVASICRLTAGDLICELNDIKHVKHGYVDLVDRGGLTFRITSLGSELHGSRALRHQGDTNASQWQKT